MTSKPRAIHTRHRTDQDPRPKSREDVVTFSQVFFSFHDRWPSKAEDAGHVEQQTGWDWPAYAALLAELEGGGDA